MGSRRSNPTGHAQAAAFRSPVGIHSPKDGNSRSGDRIAIVP